MGDDYRARGQTAAKHDILKRYLEDFAYKVIPTFGSVDYIDGFSGPWNERDSDGLSDTSIGISLAILQKVAAALGHSPSDRRIRCIFNERNPKSYQRLTDFVSRNKGLFPLLNIRTIQGEFSANANAINQIATNSFQLLFIDPTGFTGYPEEALRVFKRRNCELIINFMHSFVTRFCAGDHPDRARHLASVVGKSRSIALSEGRCSADDIEAALRDLLTTEIEFQYTSSSPIYHPEREAIHFKLLYATNHPAGLDVLRRAEAKALGEHDQRRSAIKHIQGQGELWPELRAEGVYLRTKRAHTAALPEAILGLLNHKGSKMRFDKLCAMIQQDHFVVATDVKRAVAELAERGILEPSWKERNPKARGPDTRDHVRLTQHKR